MRGVLRLFCGLAMGVLVVGLVSASSGASTDVSVSVEPLEAKIVQPITVTITVDAPADTELTWPKLESSIGDFEILSVSEPVLFSTGEEPQRWKQSLKIQSLVTGDLQFPALEIRYRLVGQEPANVRTDPVTIRIISVLAADDSPQGFRPNKKAMDVELESSPSLFARLTAIVVVASIMTIGSFWVWRRHRQQSSASEFVLKRLSEIQREHQTGRLSPLDAYLQTTEIARRFVAMQQGRNAETMTGREVIAAISDGRWLSDEHRQTLARLMEQSDEIRFAGTLADAQTLQPTLEQAQTFVRQIVESARRLPSQEVVT